MKYIKPHLSPELRAQITPYSRRDRKYTAAGVFFLLISIVLLINLLPKTNKPSLTNNKTDSTLAQSSQVQTEPEKQVLGMATKEEPAPEFTSYTVKNGDTLFNISQQYNIKWDLIAQLNGLSEPFILHPGQKLKIPQATTSKVPGKIYTIKQGDTLISIARAFNVTVDDIIAVNPNLQKSELITVGQVIKLP
ncbi:MAG: LysM peptidoglycan-binding domain-containing protein [Candidatus Doudnabacteria bacterium]|nr:LysM peptidoglycan-binding domain-containing protein [Candidatus Doudnabacteria bacterium]